MVENAPTRKWPNDHPAADAGSKPPLFLLHGHDGELFYFRELVKSLEPEQPAYGVQPVGLDGRAAFRTVEEMASHYADEILRFGPRDRTSSSATASPPPWPTR